MSLKLYILISGVQTIAKQKLFAAADKDETLDIPIPYYLIDAGDEKILIDSGISSEGGSSGLSTIREVYDPVESLAEIGIKPSQITMVIQTHLHFDHAANTKLFTSARVIVQLEELRAAYFPDSGVKHGYVEEDIKNPHIHWEPVVGMRSLLGDRVLVFPTFGHTPGHQSVLVRLEKYGNVIITGDAAPLSENLKENVPPGVASDSYEAFCSLRNIREMAHFHKAELWWGHDPEFYRRAKKSPHYYS